MLSLRSVSKQGRQARSGGLSLGFGVWGSKYFGAGSSVILHIKLGDQDAMSTASDALYLGLDKFLCGFPTGRSQSDIPTGSPMFLHPELQYLHDRIP